MQLKEKEREKAMHLQEFLNAIGEEVLDAEEGMSTCIV
jgi:hypothetical protein